jgi:hypothetical protein
MQRTSALLALLATFLLAAPLRGQEPASTPVPAADPADVESIDTIIAALYDVISGPAGERDWDRFRSLFAPRATLSPMVPRPDGSIPVRVITPEEYVQFGGNYFRDNAFYEVEAGRELERFGNVANAMSLYESRNAPDEEPFTRGVNSITLIHDGARWYVLSIAWDEVREGLPAPGYGS